RLNAVKRYKASHGDEYSIEESVRAIDGIETIRSNASEGSGQVTLELFESADADRVYRDVEQEVRRIRTLPEDSEDPVVTLVKRRHDVLEVMLYGEVEERSLRENAEIIRDALLADPEISQVDFDGARNFEIHVTPSTESLRRHGLSLQSIAQVLAASSVEVPGGSIDTRGGEILVRVRQRSDWASQFADIPVVVTPEGAIVRLGEVAEVREEFEDTDRLASYNGKRAIGLGVFRIGDETPVSVSDAVRRVMASVAKDLPPGIFWAVRGDDSIVYRQRMELLVRNACYGLVLVILLLGLFLEVKLAFWVTMGVLISFIGAFWFLSPLGVSINMISMFAFIIALGIVVDDAIIVGENVFEYRQRGMTPIRASILGTRDVMNPVAIAILTNIITFMPLAFVPGFMGKIWRVVPMVVVSVFLVSWIESILILPSHLAHMKPMRGVLGGILNRFQDRFSHAVRRFIYRVYGPLLGRVLTLRYLFLAAGVAILVLTIAWVKSGHINIIAFPRVESDASVVTAMLPLGCTAEETARVRERLEETAAIVIGKNGGDKLAEGVFASINENSVRVDVYLTPPETRPISTTAFTSAWRELTGSIPGLQSLRFEADRGGPGSGQAVTVELSHRNIETLAAACRQLAASLAEVPKVTDVDDGYTPGKRQYDIHLREEGRALGLTARELARQLRASFYGQEAIRQMRGRNEVTVRLRLPEAERDRAGDVADLLIRTPGGKDVRLAEIATLESGRAYTTIERRDSRRTVTVKADVVPIGATAQVLEVLKNDLLPPLMSDFPGLSYSFEGRQADFRKSMDALVQGLLMSLFGLYVL
ncbi:MAG: efflux RND transporter permease subunit, partial [Planctomycetes bacterium]|nr:efflux RND transporter permease subunit [Planctomycetota bacterium]